MRVFVGALVALLVTVSMSQAENRSGGVTDPAGDGTPDIAFVNVIRDTDRDLLVVRLGLAGGTPADAGGARFHATFHEGGCDSPAFGTLDVAPQSTALADEAIRFSDGTTGAVTGRGVEGDHLLFTVRAGSREVGCVSGIGIDGGDQAADFTTNGPPAQADVEAASRAFLASRFGAIRGLRVVCPVPTQPAFGTCAFIGRRTRWLQGTVAVSFTDGIPAATLGDFVRSESRPLNADAADPTPLGRSYWSVDSPRRLKRSATKVRITYHVGSCFPGAPPSQVDRGVIHVERHRRRIVVRVDIVPPKITTQTPYTVCAGVGVRKHRVISLHGRRGRRDIVDAFFNPPRVIIAHDGTRCFGRRCV